jgi:hypothetical protein
MGLYDPILTNAGLLSGGKLTDSAKKKFWDSVAAQEAEGNSSIGGEIFKFPALKGGLTGDQLADKSKYSTLHSIFLDTLYEKVANLLDLPGATPLATPATGFVFDVTGVPLPPNLNIPLPPPVPPPLDLLAKILGLDLKSPTFLVELPIALVAKLKISVALPKLPSIPAFPMLGISIPPIPNLPSLPPPPSLVIPQLVIPPLPGLPPLVMPDLAFSFVKLPIQFILETLIPDPMSLLKLVTSLIPKLPMSIVDLLLEKVGLILSSLKLVAPPLPTPPPPPSLLLSCFLVLIKNVAALTTSVIIGQILGAGLLSATPILPIV